jgi:indole-3-glycerol phosphate synthase
MIPPNYLKISESGISSTKEIFKLKEYGYDGFLIGENFMKNNDPVSACNDFIKKL